jgi:hypothetical protein
MQFARRSSGPLHRMELIYSKSEKRLTFYIRILSID